MLESQLKELFTKEEFDSLVLFILDKNYFWCGKNNNFCYTEFIQEFISTLEDNERKEEIVFSCIQKYPQILGIVSELN